MSVGRDSWMQTKEEFVGVPYLYDGDNHPLRNDGSWPFLANQIRSRGPQRTSHVLPAGFLFSDLSGSDGYCLISPDQKIIGKYEHKNDGYLLMLDASIRGKKFDCNATEDQRKLGAMFLAACIIDMQDKSKKQVIVSRSIGTYSPGGLKTSLSAHDILVEYAACYRGEHISDSVKASRTWVPESVPPVSITDRILDQLDDRTQRLSIDEKNIVLSYLVGSAGELKAVTDAGKRVLGFAFCDSGIYYDGFALSNEAGVKSRIACQYGLSRRDLLVDNADITKISFPIAGVKAKRVSRIELTSVMENIVNDLGLTQSNELKTGPRRKL